jgi:GcrA cell cycle regulator
MHGTFEPRQRQLGDGRLVLQPYKHWSSERDQLLHHLWLEGKSQSVIAAELGVTTNSVAGRLSRMKLRFLTDRPKREPKPRAPKKLKPWSERKRYYVNRRSIPMTAPEQVALRLSVPELTNKSCRFIVTDDHPMLYCGHESADGFSYCAHHCGVMYRPAEARERAPRPR